MSTCEQCWNEAFFRSRLRGTSQVDEYLILLDNVTHNDEAAAESDNR
jgi:hypothetical protein